MSREIDYLVGLHIMEWTLNDTGSWYDGVHYTGYMNYPPPAAYRNCDNKYFRPSTDIAAAMEALNKLGEEGYRYSIEYDARLFEQKFIVKVAHILGNKSGGAAGNKLPLIIALAALKAKGVEVEG